MIEENGKDDICWNGSSERNFTKPKVKYTETSFIKLSKEELSKNYEK